MITVVAGIPRSGTSLMMRMLHTGGMDVFADNYCSYETHEVLGLPFHTNWLDKAEGKAIKILETLRHFPPKGRDYRFIVMTRNPTEQAKSQVKFARATGIKIASNKKTFRLLAESNESDTAALIAFLKDYPKSRFLVVAFEDLISQPKSQARRVADFCGGLDLDRMAAQVVGRSSDCLSYLLELEMPEGVAKNA